MLAQQHFQHNIFFGAAVTRAYACGTFARGEAVGTGMCGCAPWSCTPSCQICCCPLIHTCRTRPAALLPCCSCCVLVFQGDGGHRNEVLTLSWKAEAGHALPADSQSGEAPGGELGMLLSGEPGLSAPMPSVGKTTRELRYARHTLSSCVLAVRRRPPLSPRPPSTIARARPPSVAGMDNQIKIWGLQPYAHVVAASEEWVPGGPRVFPTSHVTMPLFSSEVGESLGGPGHVRLLLP